MTLALIVILPLLGSLLPLLFKNQGRSLCATMAMVAPVIGLALLWRHADAVFAGQTLIQSRPWLSELGLNISFRLDGLSFLFALMIQGIGLLVILYARYYLSKNDPMGRFFCYLQLFMSAMLGVVLSENLLLLMVFFALGNLASALAPDYHSLLLARFVAGLPHGAYFGVAALVAASLVAPNKRAAAISLVMLGLTLAILVGNPLATLLGQQIDWRYAFVAVAVIALLTVLLIALFLPLDRSVVRSNPLAELQAFRRIQVWYALGIGAIGFAGMFCVFSYLAVTLLEVTGVAPLVVPLAVATFGAGTLVGNLAGGWLFERLQFAAVGVVLLWSVAVLLLFPFAVQTLWSALLAAFLVGTMVALSPPLQTRLMDVAADAQTLAAASHHAAFNVANALGPWLGGLAIGAGLGWTVTGYVGALTAVAGLGLFLLSWLRQRRHPEELVAPA